MAMIGPSFNHRLVNTGLLVLRIGMGIMFIIHGASKLFGGPEKWGMVGKSMGNFGITFAPEFWGFMAGLTEFGGGILLILGLFFRITNALLLCVMITAMVHHLTKGDGFNTYSHPIEDGIVFLSLLITGPGNYSLDRKFLKK